MLIYLEPKSKSKEARLKAQYATIENYFNVGWIYFFKIHNCAATFIRHTRVSTCSLRQFNFECYVDVCLNTDKIFFQLFLHASKSQYFFPI